MGSAGTKDNRRGLEAQVSGFAGGTQRRRLMPQEETDAQGIPHGTLAASNVGAKKRNASKSEVRRADESSGMSARTVGRNKPIHQKVIRHPVTVGGSDLLGGRFLDRGVHGQFALLDEPASEIGSGVFFEPLIEQGGDFLAQIRGVSEAGKFIRLKRIARGGEKEFPGGLGTGLRHGNLQRAVQREYGVNNNRRVIYESSALNVISVWKSVEKQENLAGCCSACAGDYEDPDWTAWDADPYEDEEVSEGGEDDGDGQRGRQ